ncbi:hypothetical protein P6709_06055 [Jeotgalibacillus sp. ET6]|uniref:hypothetical protein n=1 Tax=Jeotgalibacillus sp. ET6 TaxID=3037260 RepID=UPI0024183196|nr:hypothetical protein [Jeotgalibacillus sp. ET6]MDG5471303.1 hypothetical protein [Jeotgalibacillus sp. ET6]
MKYSLFIFSVIIMLCSACNNNPETSELKELRGKLVEITQLGGDEEVEEDHIDQAIHEAASLGIQGEDRDWFVRSFLISKSTGEEIKDMEEIYERSQLKKLYEKTWQDVALERYEVTLDEERLQVIIEETLQPVKEEKENEIEIQFYLADSLGYSIDDFFYTFDRHIYEKWVISEELYPLLEKEYNLEENQEISHTYRMEVIDEIVKARSL